MEIDEPKTSPEAMCSALRDVTGLEFDPTRPEERAAALILLQKLLASPTKAEALSTSIVQHMYGTPAATALPAFTPKTVPRPIDASDTFDDDLPTQSSQGKKWVDEWRELRSLDFLSLENLDVFVQKTPTSWILCEPKIIGFHETKSSAQSWSIEAGQEWHEFLIATERLLNTKRWGAMFETKKLAHAEHAARNYSIVHLRAGDNQVAAHFVFTANELYYLVNYNDRRFADKVLLGEVETFSQHLVGALGGHESEAQATVTSLRSIFN